MPGRIKAFYSRLAGWQFFRFAAVGVLNTLVDLAVFTILAAGAGLHSDLAHGAGYLCGMLNSYTLNRKVTFNTSGSYFGREMIRFFAVNGVVLWLSFFILHFFENLGLWYMWAKLATTAVTLCLGFALNRLAVFKAGE